MDPQLQSAPQSAHADRDVSDSAFDNTTVSHAPPAFQLQASPLQLETREEILDSKRIEDDEYLQATHDSKRKKATARATKSESRIRRVQQALVDAGYLNNKTDVNGSWDANTKGAIKKFQEDQKLDVTGKLDRSTVRKLDDVFDGRESYVKAGRPGMMDTSNGTRKITKAEGKEAMAILNPAKSKKKKSKFRSEIKGVTYEKAMEERMRAEIDQYFKNYEDLKKERKDPKNLYSEADIMGPVKAARKASSDVYSRLMGRRETKFGETIKDLWEDEKATVDGKESIISDSTKPKSDREKADKELREKEEEMLMYIVNTDCEKISAQYNADIEGKKEKKILAKIFSNLLKDTAIRKKVRRINQAWPGAEGNLIQYVQRFKKKSMEANRIAMWSLFHTSIHEYIHATAHPKFILWTETLGESQKHTLLEGLADFFTKNIQSTLTPKKLKAYQEDVEGIYYDAKKDVPTMNEAEVNHYTANDVAEKMVAIVGVHNAQSAYFKGETELISGKYFNPFKK